MAPHQKILIPNIINEPKHPPGPPSLNPETRSALLTALMSTSAIPKIHTTLLSSCQSTGWLDAVRERALQLLRSGECTSYREIMAVLKEEVRAPLLPPPPRSLSQGYEMNGNGSGINVKEGDNRVIDVRIPPKVYNDGVRAVRQALEAVVDDVVD